MNLAFVIALHFVIAGDFVVLDCTKIIEEHLMFLRIWDNTLAALATIFTCKWSMTANDTLPSNLTFDKILTVLRCESRSGQFRSSEHNIKKEKKKTIFYVMIKYSSSKGTANLYFSSGCLSNVAVLRFFLKVTLFYSSFMFKYNTFS